MAKKIIIETEVKGGQTIDKAINGFSRLKAELREAKGELANFEIGTTGFENAQKKVVALTDKLGDLQDAIKVQGTGVEKLGASFNLLKESLGTADIDKAKIAFQGIGAAMSAIPIFLLIEGLKYLYENFDQVIEIYNEFVGVEEDDLEVQKKLNEEREETSKLLDEIIKKNQSYIDRQIELTKIQEKIKDLEVDSTKNSAKIYELKKKAYDLEIQNIGVILESKKGVLTIEEELNLKTQKYIAEQGKARLDLEKQFDDKKKLEEKKKLLDEEEKAFQALWESLKDAQDKEDENERARRLKEKEETRKHLEDLKNLRLKADQEAVQEFTNHENALEKVTKNSFEQKIRQIDIEEERLKNSARFTQEELVQIEEFFSKKRLEITTKEISEKIQLALSQVQNLLGQFQSLAQQQSSYDLAITSKAFQDKQNLLNQQQDQELQNLIDKNAVINSELDSQMEKELSRENLTNEQRNSIIDKYNKKKRAQELKNQKEEIELKNKQALADFAIAKARFETEEAIKKKAFDNDKKYRIAMTTINSIMAGIGTYNGVAQALGYTPPALIAAGIAAAAVTAAGAFAVNQIKNQEYAGGSAPVAPVIAAIPSDASGTGESSSGDSSVVNRQTLFSTGQSQNTTITPGSAGESAPIRAYVLSQEITSQQQLDAAIATKSTF